MLILISQGPQLHGIGQEVVDGEDTVHVRVKHELNVVPVLGTLQSGEWEWDPVDRLAGLSSWN